MVKQTEPHIIHKGTAISVCTFVRWLEGGAFDATLGCEGGVDQLERCHVFFYHEPLHMQVGDPIHSLDSFVPKRTPFTGISVKLQISIVLMVFWNLDSQVNSLLYLNDCKYGTQTQVGTCPKRNWDMIKKYKYINTWNNECQETEPNTLDGKRFRWADLRSACVAYYVSSVLPWLLTQ